MLLIPCLHNWDVQGSTTPPGAEVKGAWCPEETDPIGRVVTVEGRVREEGLDVVWQDKLIILLRFWLIHLGGREEGGEGGAVS